MQRIGRNGHDLAMTDFPQSAAVDCFAHRIPQGATRAGNDALPVLKILAVWIGSSIDDVQAVAPRATQADCLTRMYHSTSRRTWRSV